ncbi:hypothetical protein GCM10023204_22260 [Actinomycetospora succinea]
MGCHLSEDTAYYLRKGYRVVAFEVNCDFMEGLSNRFRSAVGSGLLTLVWGAITENPVQGVVVNRNPTKSVWGTTDERWVELSATRGTECPDAT